ncbi:MAG: class I SAM-dependent methyltransferase [Candidatus Levybacteria bacterium]|nr:class I SAM-dependent methyltransferase [Candidatus Levybacteria bacterium]
MKKCIVCNTKQLKLLKEIGKGKIFECESCKLASTELKILRTTENQDILINYYNLEKYILLKNQQKRKFFYIIKILKKFVKSGDILDVGAGFGLFDSLLMEKGSYKMDIIEPDLHLYFINNQKEKVNVHKTNYQNFLSKNNKIFNCILFIDSLEHFNNPNQILKKTKKILSRNGHIIINLPNYKSLMAKICKHWSWWMIEDHKYHFSPDSIEKILEKNGFEMIYLTSYESFSDFKKNLDGNFIYIKNPVKRKLIKLIFFAFFVPFYVTFRKFLWFFKYGGLILIVARNR